MLVTLEEAKNYLRVDTVDDDRLIETILSAAHQMSMDILRTDDPAVLEQEADAKVAVLYATAYLYEHREEADHKALVLSLRALLSGSRKEAF
ncbi:head-tail connector protein [Blautia luti]|uniref:head-tail connector protein n=1 Tax=Blautia luti TaxID=89014 RepID=UPI001D031EA5|nr:head-tail connector protein [Blautia luti]MCB5474277.1 head-tail connector protein [Blautia luti]